MSLVSLLRDGRCGACAVLTALLLALAAGRMPHAREAGQEAAGDENPYAAPAGLNEKQLIDYVQKMLRRPESIRKRLQFVEALVEAAERILSMQPDDAQRQTAALTLMSTLHEQAVLGDEKADARLMQWAEKLAADPAKPVAAAAALHLLEKRVIAARKEQLKTEEIGKLLQELRTYFQTTTLEKKHLRLASETVGLINTIGDVAERNKLFDEFGALFAKSSDPEMARYAKSILKKPDAPSTKAPGEELVGQTLELTGTTLEGDAFDWSAYRGKVVLVDFWATWCGPCVAELPNLKAAYEKYHARGFEVVGISLDQDVETLRAFVEKQRIPWTNLFDEGHPMAKKYKITAIPTALLVDKDGKVVTHRTRGAALEQELARLLGEAK
jgi:thiol-disulfide isomerase/thioredoxin